MCKQGGLNNRHHQSQDISNISEYLIKFVVFICNNFARKDMLHLQKREVRPQVVRIF